MVLEMNSMLVKISPYGWVILDGLNSTLIRSGYKIALALIWVIKVTLLGLKRNIAPRKIFSDDSYKSRQWPKNIETPNRGLCREKNTET